MSAPIDALLRRIADADTVRVSGRVVSVIGLSVRCVLPGARLGDLVRIERRVGEPLLAEIVGFDASSAVLLPYGSLEGVSPDDVVVSTGAPLTMRCSDALVGRVLDGLGRPFDGGDPPEGEPRSIGARPPHPLARKRIDTPLPMGIRALDSLLTIGVGQRVGLFAGSGVGKSTLLGQIARQAEADVVVVCLVGERGREVREFLEDSLGERGREKCVVVCATSDAPALVRMKCAHVATTVAEYFRDAGKNVLLLVDSVTRFARAAREAGLAAGEPPARRGYPPSVFAELPVLLERSGASDRGAITAIYTVLVEGGDLDEPIADEVRGILDGHVVLDRALGARGRWPAIDPLQSLSRTMPQVTREEHREAASRLRRLLAVYEGKRDLVMLGAYARGSDAELDHALERIEAVERFLAQRPDESADYAATIRALAELA